jgi:NAD-dependent SIR2 family protein deacetylase
LTGLESSGLRGVISQNVDGLHQAAAPTRVIGLHGDIGRLMPGL